MKERFYNKLVRDEVPAIIKESGSEPVTRTIKTDEEYLLFLKRKLQEEMQEFDEDGSLDELCDILEVLDAIIALKGITTDEIERVKRVKNRKNGRFEKRIFLEKVIDPE